MKVFIDQSGRIEYTANDTVVAYSNGTQKAIKIKASEKRKLQRIFKETNKINIFAYKSLAILIYLLLKDDLKNFGKIIIDKEFVGKDDLIKNYIVQFIKKDGKKFDSSLISFDFVGKQCGAHKRAIAVFRGNYKPDRTIKFEDVKKYVS